MEFLQEELDEILNIFSQEGAEILQSMDKNLLLLEKKPNNMDIAMHLFRDAHSLKGSARMLGFEGIQNVAHRIEDVLGLIREQKLNVTTDITDTISDALSLISVLIKKTVEQKSEYKSDETEKHIIKLQNICDNANGEEKYSLEDSFKHNFNRFEDLIMSIVASNVKYTETKEIDGIQEIINNGSKFLQAAQDIGEELSNKVQEMLDCAAKIIEENAQNEETIYKLNIKINECLQTFTKEAEKRNIKTRNYYEEVYKIISNNSGASINQSNLKNTELIELIQTLKEIISNINSDKHAVAETKSLLNEIISKSDNNELKKIFQTVLDTILNFEKSDFKIEDDSFNALKEVFITTVEILEAKTLKNSYNDFMEEIELLNQKTFIIAQMIAYELKNQGKEVKQQKPLRPLTWEEGLDSTAIKTLRVNSDKLDMLVNQIGNLIVTKIKSHENISLVKTIQDELVELQKHYHKIGYYMKFYEKKYIQENITSNAELIQKKDPFLGYNKQLIAFNNANADKMNHILNNLNFLMKELQENNIKLNTTTGEIENMVKAMRVLPLSTVFNLFPRMVHNIAKDRGKEIELTIAGGEVSADKKIIEDIKIPIMHIVRNSLDHGIETPRERERIGKNKVGNISIKAVQNENKIVITIKDDGRGINIPKIKQKAVEKGLITKEGADNLSKEQLANFIFYPGFSTGDKVTELSGRGLGLDIVHTKISQLNGRIDVYSEENKGTVVAMELPTTMATMRVFIIKEGDRQFALPAGNIEAVLRVFPHEIKTREDKNYFIYKDKAIPINSLASLLNIKEEKSEQTEFIIVVLKYENTISGLIVQKFIGDEEILNKKLPEPILRVKNISGITTLANGEMCLLLNITDILSATKNVTDKITSTKSLTLQDNSRYNVLLVDDSTTTRRLVGNIISSGGYNVDMMPDAKSALRAFETKKYDLIITDYEMPLLNGIDFIKLVREKDPNAKTPILMLTSIRREGLREEAHQAGAQEFIMKENFEQKSFMETIVKYLNLKYEK